ncbi:15565_t:CDS:2, partial [Acaulospora morrowiae]
KDSGYQLRQDDPSVLKEIIQLVHNETSKKDPRSLGSRTKFMIETIVSLKNNRLKQQSAVANTESLLRMKKFLSNLGKRIQVRATEPLRVSLDDIRSIETKGKWWIVGASWTANMIDHPSTSATPKTEKNEVASDALLNLAKQQKMNTEVRRSIFVVLMSSEEKIHNPYYALIAQRLCNYDHSFKITFQYCLWDFLRECGEDDIGGMELVKIAPIKNKESEKVELRRLVNVSKLYAMLLSSGELSVIILKTASFTKLHPQSRLFFQLLFSNVIILTQTQNARKRNPQVLAQIFLKALPNPTLSQGILFFLHHFVKKGGILKDENEKEIVKWGCDVIKQAIKKN